VALLGERERDSHNHAAKDQTDIHVLYQQKRPISSKRDLYLVALLGEREKDSNNHAAKDQTDIHVLYIYMCIGTYI